MQSQLWDSAVLKQWSSAIATPSLWAAHMGLEGPHGGMGVEFIWQMLSESQKVWLAHARAQEGLIKARSGLEGTMAWALREL